MVRPVLSLERLSLDEREGKVGYRWGREAAELETMDYLEFIARVTSHIPTRARSWSATMGSTPTPTQFFEQVALMAAEEGGDYE
jgi:hypothetical protein